MAAGVRMANVEGALRMKRAGKFLILGGVGSMLLAGLVVVVIVLLPASSFNPGMVIVLVLVYLGLLLEVAGAVLWILGWIVEGFLLPKQRD
jgi:hypothetical protein